MLNKKILKGLKKQLNKELESSLLYLSMGSWVEYTYGNLEGIYTFLYDHSEEEKKHMLKLMRYINKRGAYADIISQFVFKKSWNTLKELFQKLFQHEQNISNEINLLVDLSLKEKDFFTYNFLQWYIEEQIEEEGLSKMILDKINFLEEDKGGLYLFDCDIKNFHKKNRKNIL